MTTPIITIPEMAHSLRLTADMEVVPSIIADILAGLMVVGLDQIQLFSPTAPTSTKAEALTLFVGFIFDSTPTALNNAPAQNPFRMSGAMAMLAPWHTSRGAVVV